MGIGQLKSAIAIGIAIKRDGGGKIDLRIEEVGGEVHFALGIGEFVFDVEVIETSCQGDANGIVHR